MTDQLITWTVDVTIDGDPVYQVDVPTTLGADAAARRAKWAVAHENPSMDLTRIGTGEVTRASESTTTIEETP